MKKNNNILNLYRKIICSLLLISRNTSDSILSEKSLKYIDDYLKLYAQYNDKGICSIINYEEIIDYCNECYEDKDIFDYAEDVEYGLKELYEITIKGGKK